MRKVQISMQICDLIVQIDLLQNLKEESALTGLCRDVYRQPLVHIHSDVSQRKM